MKGIQKEIQKTEYVTYYVATDGTEFKTMEECQVYEQSAYAVVRTKFMKLVVDKGDEPGFFNVGSDDCTVYAVKLHSQEDADVVLQLYYLKYPHIKGDGEVYKKCSERACSLVNTALHANDILFVGEYDDGYPYIINTRNNIVDRLLSIDKPKEDIE